jgi:hypothetical protein
MRKKQKEAYLAVTRIRKSKGDREMLELAKRFIDKECIIYTLSNGQITGTIKEVTEHGLLVESEIGTEVVNLDFVTRIRDYPRNKKGKKKSIILD